MKNVRKLTALLCAAALLCSCDSARREETVDSTETTTSVNTAATPATTTVPETTTVSVTESDESAEEEIGADLPRMDGSTSATPLEIGLKSGFLGISYTQAKQLVSHTTTHDSFKRLIGGEVDLILSVPISEEQQRAADEAGVTLYMEPVAKEGFVFVVNAENPVDSLTSEQLRGIYSGEITNWAQVGGNDEPILAYQRNTDSGSQNYMTVFMGDTPLLEPKKEMVAGMMGSLMDAVASYDNSAGAIGYSVYSYAAQMYANANRVKFIAVDGVAPSKATMADESYPLLSCTYAIYTDQSPESARAFVQKALSEEGQGYVLESGYLPVNGMEVPEKYLPYEAVGTGEPKPADFAPSTEYNCFYIQDGNGIRVKEDGYYHLSILKDKEFEERINADIRAAMDELKRYDDPKYYKQIENNYKTTGLTAYASCRNGYLSILLGYLDRETEVDPMEGAMLYDHAVTLNYDLFAQKRIERFSDLFYEGEDFVSAVNEAVGEYLGSYVYRNVEDAQKLDFSGILGEPRLFTIEAILFERDNLYLNCSLPLYFGDYILSLYSPVAQYRDMSVILNDIHAPHTNDGSYPEWETGYVIEDGKIYQDILRSAFHTDEEIAAENQFRRGLQDRAREYFASFGYDGWATENSDYHCQFGIVKNEDTHYYCLGNFSVAAGEGGCVYFDADTLEPITLETLVGENWREYLRKEDEEIENLCLFEWYEYGGTVTVFAAYPNEEAYYGYRTVMFDVPLKEVNPRYFVTE